MDNTATRLRLARIASIVGAGRRPMRGIARRLAAGLMRNRSRRRKDAMMRQVVENSPLGVVIVDEIGAIECINAAASEMFSQEEHEALGRPFRSVLGIDFSEDRDAGAADIIQSTLSNGGTQEVLGRTVTGEEIWIRLTVHTLDLGDRTVMSAFLCDITDKKRQEQAFEHYATHNELTGLLNRAGLWAASAEILKADADEHAMAAIFLLDLSQVQDVNNTLGYAVGKQMLQRLARQLSEYLPRRAALAKFGGDRFVILLPKLSSSGAVAELGHSILDEVQQPVRVDDITLEISCTIGAAIYPRHGTTADALYQHANIAMVSAKQNQSAFALYDPDRDPHSVRNLMLTNDLRRAIERDELTLVYQPKIDFHQRKILGVEVLTRWYHTEHGPVSPEEFVVHAEHTGLILPLTKWVLNAALRRASGWRDEGHDLNVAVNLCAKLLHHATLIPMVTSALNKWDYPAHCLTLEVTENAFLDNPDKAMDVVHQLVAMGISVSIDDFGTGYSSLSYLKTLAVHELKIDKSFVVGIEKSSSDRMIVQSVISMAHDLGLKVVAEGVETAEAMDILEALQCDTGQGFYFAKPLTRSDFEAWLNDSEWNRPWDKARARRRTDQSATADVIRLHEAQG
ncbi:MAG: EAL domain-containing protein [Alphaproteobacteria bacterium]|nr:EAL domain-containing protein [Alphaproteobacteria bacterium]